MRNPVVGAVKQMLRGGSSSTSQLKGDHGSPSHASSRSSKFRTELLQRLPFSIHVLVGIFAWYGPSYAPTAYALFLIIIHVGLFQLNSRTVYAAWRAGPAVLKNSETDWRAKLEKEGSSNGRTDILKNHEIVHVIIIPNYKEDEDVLRETLSSLASHPYASQNYIPVLAMEGRESSSALKAERMVSSFSSSFLDICYTVHPEGIPNDAPGKSSNVSWAANSFMCRQDERDWMFLGSQSRGNATSWVNGWRNRAVFTVIDSDTNFAGDYFDCVSYEFGSATADDRQRMMFTPPVCFDRNEREVAAPVRVTDITWALAGMSTTYNGSSVKIPTSAYSVSMSLAKDVGGWDSDAAAIGEDMHMLIKCLMSTGGNLVMKSVYSPASQLNVSGNLNGGVRGWLADYEARYKQAVRHLWGSLDVGYVIGRALDGSIGCSINKSSVNIPVNHGAVYYVDTTSPTTDSNNWLQSPDESATPSPTLTPVSALSIIHEISEDGMDLTPLESRCTTPEVEAKEPLIPLFEPKSIQYMPLAIMCVRTWEACIMLGDIVAIIIVRGARATLTRLFGTTWFPLIPANEMLDSTVFWTDRARDLAFALCLISVLFYHQYHQIASTLRWQKDALREKPRLGAAPEARPIKPIWTACADFLIFPLSLAFGPFAMFHAQTMHLITNKLTYTVSIKFATKKATPAAVEEKRDAGSSIDEKRVASV